MQHYRTETLWWQLFTDPRVERWVWPNYFTDSIVKRSAWKDEIHDRRQWSTTAIWLHRAPFTGKPRGLGSAPGSRTRGLETFGHRDEARKVISTPHTLTHRSKGGCKGYLRCGAKWETCKGVTCCRFCKLSLLSLFCFLLQCRSQVVLTNFSLHLCFSFSDCLLCVYAQLFIVRDSNYESWA